MDKLRIAMIGIKGLPAKWGGMEKYVEEIGKRLVKRGHEVTIFGSKWYCKGSVVNDYLGMKVRPLPTLHFQATDALSNAFISSLLIMRGNYDIVHFHGYASYYFIPLLKIFGKRSVITAHGIESGWDNPKYSTFASNIIKRGYMIGLKKANAVTTVADHLSAKIYQMTHISAEAMLSGLDEVSNKTPQIIKDKYGLMGLDYILFLGRVDPIKRVDWLLDLTDIVESKIKIVIAGGSQDSSTDAYYQSMIRRASGNSQIIFTGPVTGDEKAELLSNCLCMIVPSQYEGLPITVLEATAYARCCLASDIPAHKEIIEDGINGFLFLSDSKEKFIDSMKKIIALPTESLLAIGYEARRSVMNKYSWDKTTDQFEDLYHNLLNGQDKKHNIRNKKLMGQISLEREFKGLRALRSVFNRLLHSTARSLPMFPAWRVALHRLRGVKIGNGVFIGSDVFIDNTYPEIITIEDFVTIISRTFILGHSFNPIHLDKVLKKSNITDKNGVVFKKGCYIGAQCVIMPGVTIGECAVVGAGSVVTESIPEYSVAAGVPARVIRTFSKQDVVVEELA
jgi:glycosyltransferase involved in cell wall biosynthesis/acetyltransferase-like isoleucine patch superfamily enzyme